jgi:hypothetical protein
VRHAYRDTIDDRARTISTEAGNTGYLALFAATNSVGLSQLLSFAAANTNDCARVRPLAFFQTPPSPAGVASMEDHQVLLCLSLASLTAENKHVLFLLASIPFESLSWTNLLAHSDGQSPLRKTLSRDG